MKNNIDMVGGSLVRNLTVFSVPIILTNLLQIFFNAADTVVVGRFAGQEALAAVGATGSLVFLLTALFNGLSMGSNVVIAQAIGSGDTKRAVKSVHTSYMIGIYGGFILLAMGLLLSKPLLKLVATPEDIIDLSTIYMKYYFCGSVFLLIFNMGSAALRSKGDTKRPMYALGFSGIVNIVLNLILVIVFKLSVIGVAVATVASQALSAVFVTAAMINNQDETHLSLAELKLDKEIALEILRIGIPAGFQNMMFSLSNVVVTSSINSFNSSIIIAGNTVAQNLERFVGITLQAFTQSCLTFTSQNFGAKNYLNLKKITYTSLWLSMVFQSVIAGSLFIFRYQCISLFTDDPLVAEVAITRILLVVMPLFLNGVLDIFAASIRGIGYSTLPTIIMLVGICGVRLGFLYTVFPVVRTLECIYLCYPLSWIIASIIMFIYWKIVSKRLLKQNNLL